MIEEPVPIDLLGFRDALCAPFDEVEDRLVSRSVSVARQWPVRIRYESLNIVG